MADAPHIARAIAHSPRIMRFASRSLRGDALTLLFPSTETTLRPVSSFAGGAAFGADAADVAGQIVFALRTFRNLNDWLHAVSPAREVECCTSEYQRQGQPDGDLHRRGGGGGRVQRLADSLVEFAAQRYVRGSLEHGRN